MRLYRPQANQKAGGVFFRGAMSCRRVLSAPRESSSKRTRTRQLEPRRGGRTPSPPRARTRTLEKEDREPKLLRLPVKKDLSGLEEMVEANSKNPHGQPWEDLRKLGRGTGIFAGAGVGSDGTTSDESQGGPAHRQRLLARRSRQRLAKYLDVAEECSAKSSFLEEVSVQPRVMAGYVKELEGFLAWCEAEQVETATPKLVDSALVT